MHFDFTGFFSHQFYGISVNFFFWKYAILQWFFWKKSHSYNKISLLNKSKQMLAWNSYQIPLTFPFHCFWQKDAIAFKLDSHGKSICLQKLLFLSNTFCRLIMMTWWASTMLKQTLKRSNWSLKLNYWQVEHYKKLDIKLSLVPQHHLKKVPQQW